MAMFAIRFFLTIALCLASASASAQRSPTFSAPDPYVLLPLVSVFANTNGRTPVTSVPPAPTTTAVIITGGQSLAAAVATGSYVTANAGSLNLNLNDGGTYPCLNPVLGIQSNSAAVGNNSPTCIIADGLINAGTYTRVIVLPIAVGGAACAEWQPGGIYNHRIYAALARLKAINLTPATGFTGDLWILWHQGEQDNSLGTPRATLAACWRAIAQEFVNAGTGSARFFLATESIAGNVASSVVTGSQSDAVASGCPTCRAGANWDSLTGGTNRQVDGTHLTQAGNASAAALDVTIVTNCKNTVC